PEIGFVIDELNNMRINHEQVSETPSTHTSARNNTKSPIDQGANVRKKHTPSHTPRRPKEYDRADTSKRPVRQDANAYAKKDEWPHISHANAATPLLNNTDLSAKDENEFTPLHFAAQSGYTDMVKMLLEQGADVHAIGKDRFTPLHSAAQDGHTETA